MADAFAWLLLLSVFDAPIECDACDSWNRPQAPFQVFGNTYYVGTGGLGAILIDTGEGLVLLDGGLPQSAPLIIDNIRELGFAPDDIRMIGISHAHYDHVGGIAALQRISGATVVAHPNAAESLRLGALLRDDPQFGAGFDGQTYPAVDKVISMHHGTEFEIGDVTFTLLETPGHTVGGTSWQWQSCEKDRCLSIVYVDSLSPVSRDGYRFSDGLGAALRITLERVENLDCDILLSTHDFSFDLHAKLEQGKDAFVDPGACRALAKKSRAYLNRRLKSENP